MGILPGTGRGLCRLRDRIVAFYAEGYRSAIRVGVEDILHHRPGSAAVQCLWALTFDGTAIKFAIDQIGG